MGQGAGGGHDISPKTARNALCGSVPSRKRGGKLPEAKGKTVTFMQKKPGMVNVCGAASAATKKGEPPSARRQTSAP
ncbi:hypothetical protein KL86DPRO_20126 [uncultured delta proteobacterium]|uniref:Uncharacterized protein n=1 Tax=uncultured delta proteobacterium TaxID=34034 RepID=A0A212JVE3_9DELT|nr:hypothetical protein KL86DPRO_20126 [uncultured delta proteobacterium]